MVRCGGIGVVRRDFYRCHSNDRAICYTGHSGLTVRTDSGLRHDSQKESTRCALAASAASPAYRSMSESASEPILEVTRDAAGATILPRGRWNVAGLAGSGGPAAHARVDALRAALAHAAGSADAAWDLTHAEAMDHVGALIGPLLLGQEPGAVSAQLLTPEPGPPVPPRVPVGLPSELARRRPDVREAEARLHAATANIGVAEAAFYPSFRLNASVGLQALQVGRLFDLNAREFAAGPGLTVPIFERGELRASLRLTEAQQKAAALDYQRIVLRALHEVENALIAYRSEQARRAELTGAVAESRKALELARERYRQGVSDFLQVLDAQRTMLANELLLADSTTVVSGNLVTLYKALGGGWEKDLPEVGRNAERTKPEAGTRSR